MAEMGGAAEEAAGQSSGRDPCHPPRKRPEPRAPPRLLACQEAGRGRRLGKFWRRRKAPRASPGWAPFAFGRGGGLAMAAGERSGGSDRRFAQRRSPLLLLLLLPLLLPVRPALGNEGGASGSCRCEKFSTEPALVRRFPDRLVTWERCRGLIRFIFPKNLVCGLDDAPWVLRLISRKRDMREGSAKVSSSERSSQPSPSSRAPLQPLSSMGSTPVVPMETLPSQLVPRETPLSQRLPALTHTTAVPALESVWSVVPPRNGAVAEVSPTRFGQEEGVPGWHQTAVLSALGIVLLLVIVGLLCWWRPPRRGCQAALTSEQQVWMLQRPGGGPHLQAQNRSSHWLRLGRLKGTAKGNCILWIQERPPFNCG
ncbi:C-X-C motif chemokine 16 isoform X2 [Pantherophis guttatus]|uniref:C-X-C motif chemokine 16 n=1 Tax=Pantherophis guttatus TaxID=94885 RepID=A0A6P9CU27_PANGU|nr:C-X-C motif chemokine 16 isoform X2 [Pantherophis guttatus]